MTTDGEDKIIQLLRQILDLLYKMNTEIKCKD